MEIQPNRNQPIRRINPGSAARKGPSAASSTSGVPADSVEIDLFSHLVDHLSQMPEKREEFLEEARQLLKDPNYPNEAQLAELENALQTYRESGSGI